MEDEEEDEKEKDERKDENAQMQEPVSQKNLNIKQTFQEDSSSNTK